MLAATVIRIDLEDINDALKDLRHTIVFGGKLVEFPVKVTCCGYNERHVQGGREGLEDLLFSS